MANEKIKGLRYAHAAIVCKDFERSLAFYRALGFTPYVTWGEGKEQIMLLDIGDGSKVELFAKGSDEYSEMGKFLHLAFAVENVDEAYHTALAAGATPLIPPKDMPLESTPKRITLRVAFVKGPDGEEIEFCKEKVFGF